MKSLLSIIFVATLVSQASSQTLDSIQLKSFLLVSKSYSYGTTLEEPIRLFAGYLNPDLGEIIKEGQSQKAKDDWRNANIAFYGMYACLIGAFTSLYIGANSGNNEEFDSRYLIGFGTGFLLGTTMGFLEEMFIRSSIKSYNSQL